MAVPAVDVLEVRAVFKDFVSAPAVQYSTTLWLNGPEVRIDTTRFTGGKTDLIFFGNRNVLYHLDHQAKKYVELDTGRLGRAGEQIRALLDGLREKFGTAPTPAATSDPAPRVAAKEGVWILEGLECRLYEIHSGERKLQDVWAAPWPSTGIAARDLASFWTLTRAYEKLFAPLTALGGGWAWIPCSGLQQVPGYPVLVKQWKADHLDYEIQLMKPRRTTRPDTWFALPGDYTKTWLGTAAVAD